MATPRRSPRLVIDVICVGLVATIVGTIASLGAMGRAVAMTPPAGNPGPAHRATALGLPTGYDLTVLWAHPAAVLVAGCAGLIVLTLIVTIRHGQARPAPLERQPLPTAATRRDTPSTRRARPARSTTVGAGPQSAGHAGLPGTAAPTGRARADASPHSYP